MENKPFIFIGGHHRSGTSLLHRLLARHPDISKLSGTGVPEDEGQHVQSVYKPAAYFGGPGKYIFNSKSYMNEEHLLATPQAARTILKEWSRYYDRICKFWIEKSPPNLIRTRYLQKIFPNSKFIVIFRHPIAVSYATRKWSKTSINSLLEHTIKGYEIFLSDRQFLRKSYIIRYEDFVRNPQQQINSIYNFLDLDPVQNEQHVRSDVNSKYFQMMKRDDSGYQYSKDLELRANLIGYSLHDPEVLLNVPFLGSMTNSLLPTKNQPILETLAPCI
jgi:hypothetical protein